MTRKGRIIKVIQEFHFWNYGMDEVSSAIEEDLEAQEWIPALADAIIEATDSKNTGTAFVCAHCGGAVRDNWIASGALCWHVNVPECWAAAATVLGRNPDGSKKEDREQGHQEA